MPISPSDATSILGAENKNTSYTGPATDYLALFTVAPRQVTDAVLNSTTTITSATASFIAGDVGTAISGYGIPAGTTIASVTNGTTVVLSASATQTATGVKVVFGGQEVTGGVGPYARQAVTWGTARDGSVANSVAINFAGMPACTVLGHGVFDAATNGSLRQSNTVTSTAVAAGNTVQYAIGALTSTVS
jgi:hypothetical protein